MSALGGLRYLCSFVNIGDACGSAIQDDGRDSSGGSDVQQLEAEQQAERAVERPSLPTQQVAVLVALGAAALVLLHLALSLSATGGVFTYTLDDPYIHLALSEQIAQGHYGLEPSSAAAPSSSILWPFLLTPFAGTGVFEYVPLIINAVALAATAAVVFAFLCQVLPLRRRHAAAATLILIEVGYIAGAALTGMEHSLQVAAAAGVTVGVAGVVRTGAVPRWLPPLLVTAPLIRYEGLAASVLAAGVIALAGHRRTALFTGLVCVAALAAFSAFLVSIGLDVLPSSVLVKSAAGSGGFGEAAFGILVSTLASIASNPALWLALAVIILIALRDEANRHLFLFGAGTLLANIVFATGPDRRYDLHLVVMIALLLAVGWQHAVRADLRPIVILMAVVAVVQYGTVTIRTPAAAQEIYLQQHQTSRFVAEILREPVAVNDLGLVSLRSDYAVLDLWGLGDATARRARRDAAPNWMSDLAAEHDIGVAVVYADWFGNALPQQWDLVGVLTLDDETTVAVGEPDVSFYATRPDAAGRLRAALNEFTRTLPAGVTLRVE